MHGCQPHETEPSGNKDAVEHIMEITYYLYNAGFGEYGWSKEGLKALMRLGYKEQSLHLHGVAIRDDPRAVAIFDKMGSKWCSGGYCKMDKLPFPTKYVSYVRVKENDGKESPFLDFDTVFLGELRKLLELETSTIDDIRSLEKELIEFEKHYKAFCVEQNVFFF
jgi:hypothetical protein